METKPRPRTSVSLNAEVAPGVVCDTKSAIIQTGKVNRGTAGTIIELRCPESQVMSIFGKNQSVSLRCFDKSDREPDPATRMNFKRITRYGGISRICRATYGDLSPEKKIKHSFPEGLYLRGEEVFFIEVLNPDIDIDRIELSIDADIFEMFDQAC